MLLCRFANTESSNVPFWIHGMYSFHIKPELKVCIKKMQELLFI